MGFLDKRDRIVDIVLTERGRELFSQGLLDFASFAVFDDGLDYDPVPSTGSFSDDDRRDQMESSLVMEAPYVRSQGGSADLFEPTYHVFTAADGFDFIPQLSGISTGSYSVSCEQHQGSKTGAAYTRANSTVARIDLKLSGDFARDGAGFSFRVFVSGSAGISELEEIRDSDHRRAFDPFIACAIDDEEVG